MIDLDSSASMSPLARVVLLALLPAAGNFLGSSVAETIPIPKRTLSLVLHVAAGIFMLQASPVASGC